jgi:hypothetical protein
MRLAVARSPAALRDDCALAGILVLQFTQPRSCRPVGPAIDIADLARHGPHALTIEGGKVRIATVAGARGDRPWTRKRVEWRIRKWSKWTGQWRGGEMARGR